MTLDAPPGRYLAEPPHAVTHRALRGRHFFTTWTVTVGLGEALGFLAPAAAGAASVDLPVVAGVPLVLAAGAVEGAVLGWSQALVLSRAVPGLARARWVVLTSAAAVAAYVLGYAMTAAGGSGAGWLAIAGATVAGALLLLTLGGAQWLELRRHLPGAARWIGWTALGWLVALGAFLAIATPLWHAGQDPATVVAIGAGAGIVMAFVQSAVTGGGLLRMLARAGWSS